MNFWLTLLVFYVGFMFGIALMSLLAMAKDD
jgi:hypothetical protein